MDSLPWDLAQELKDFASNAAWCCANEAKWRTADAAKNREAAEHHFQAAVETGGLSSIVMSDVYKMVWAAGKHASLERLSVLQASQSADAKHAFQHSADFVKLSGEMSERGAAHLRWMAWNAAWLAANARAGNEADARRDKGRFEQHARALRGGLLRGVNLGGWLLLERWMNTSVFAGFTEAEAPDEVSLCERLEERSPGEAAARITAWRRAWITKQDFQDIKAVGFNSVRVPFGWWCVEGVEALGLTRGSLVGPAMHLLDQAVAWASETGPYKTVKGTYKTVNARHKTVKARYDIYKTVKARYKSVKARYVTYKIVKAWSALPCTSSTKLSPGPLRQVHIRQSTAHTRQSKPDVRQSKPDMAHIRQSKPGGPCHGPPRPSCRLGLSNRSCRMGLSNCIYIYICIYII